MGNKGNSIIDHLITPITQVPFVDEIMLVSLKPGPNIKKVRYYNPPKTLRSNRVLAVIYEAVCLTILSIFKNPSCIMGYLLVPHGLLAFVVAKLTKKPVGINFIAGPIELFSGGSPIGVDINKDLTTHGKLLSILIKQANFFTTTGTITEQFLKNKGFNENKIYPIINPPNKHRFYNSKSSKKFDILWLGRLAKVKCVETFLYSLVLVKKKLPNITAIIVGDGPSRNQLETLSTKLGIDDIVTFLGYKENVEYYYNRAKVFVLTSEREGFPNVFLEAQMCGVPCIISNCGDITDIAKHNVNSIIINNHKDYNAYAEAILKQLLNESFYLSLKLNAYKDFKDLENNAKITWTKILSNFNVD